MNRRNTRPAKHIVLTSHPSGSKDKPPPVHWGAASAAERGPIVGTLGEMAHRNAIGTHSGQYALYRALAVAAGSLDPVHVPDLTDTSPVRAIGPHPQWADPKKIVSDGYDDRKFPAGQKGGRLAGHGRQVGFG